MIKFIRLEMIQREPDDNVDVLVGKGIECAAPILAGTDDVTVVQGSQLVRDQRLTQARLATDAGDVVLTVAEGKQDRQPGFVCQ